MYEVIKVFLNLQLAQSFKSSLRFVADLLYKKLYNKFTTNQKSCTTNSQKKSKACNKSTCQGQDAVQLVVRQNKVPEKSK